MSYDRRAFLKQSSLTGVAATVGVTGLSGFALADNVGDGDWPKNHAESSQIQINELGHEIQYTTSAGSTLDLVDNAVWLPGSEKWQYVYLTSADASNCRKQVGSSGDGSKYAMFEGDQMVNITEHDAPSQVSTNYFGNADWGLGVTTGQDHGYSWSTATVQSIIAVINHFADSVSGVTTADQIHTYWKKASQNGAVDNGIEHEWKRYKTRQTTGHFMRFNIVFPSEQVLDVDYVDMTVENKLRNTLFENDGDNIPNKDYSMSWSLSHPVLPSPSSANTTQMKEYGIKKKRAGDIHSLAIQGDVDPNQSIYVAENPGVKVRPLRE
ncbi:twin-arginine translocation signal domain-containing protein [Halorussus litoreus]|uniref:twin-arginine translocation signal domain-containing protein n=1 Tax=Halorussus litoreus TaxID=1710536 RepID=UPI000E250766|nr:twin-arginine translocation signal domain-containing protein [Halorussus litoreus]